MIVPGGRIVSQAVDVPPRDQDGIGAVVRDRRGPCDSLDPIGVHSDGVTPVIPDRAIADGRGIRRTTAIDSVARVVMNGAVGDRGAAGKITKYTVG